MKAGRTQSEIDRILGGHNLTSSWEQARRTGRRVYSPHEVQNLSIGLPQSSRNAAHIDERISNQVKSSRSLQWSPDEIPSHLPTSHETIYKKVYAEKMMGGHLLRALRCKRTQHNAMPAAMTDEVKSPRGDMLRNAPIRLSGVRKFAIGRLIASLARVTSMP